MAAARLQLVTFYVGRVIYADSLVLTFSRSLHRTYYLKFYVLMRFNVVKSVIHIDHFHCPCASSTRIFF